MRVAVLHGGRSSEHDVSLASAEAVATASRRPATRPLPVLLERDGRLARAGRERLALAPGGGLLGADVAFPVLHGPFGEDGTVQGLLELLDVPTSAPGVLASSLCMDKVVFKDVLAAAGVPQVDYAPCARRAGAATPAPCGPSWRGSGCRCSSSPRGWAPRSGSPRSSGRPSSTRRSTARSRTTGS